MKKGGVFLLQLMAVLVGVVFLGALIVPNFIRARPHSRGVGCKSNVKNIGIACEMYFADHKTYPAFLSQLTPEHLRALPICPSAGRQTYAYRKLLVPSLRCTLGQDHDSECGEKRVALFYELVEAKFRPKPLGNLDMECPSGGDYVAGAAFETYQVFCRGSYHKSGGTPPNFPQYDGLNGLQER